MSSSDLAAARARNDGRFGKWNVRSTLGSFARRVKARPFVAGAQGTGRRRAGAVSVRTLSLPTSNDPSAFHRWTQETVIFHHTCCTRRCISNCLSFQKKHSLNARHTDDFAISATCKLRLFRANPSTWIVALNQHTFLVSGGGMEVKALFAGHGRASPAYTPDKQEMLYEV